MRLAYQFNEKNDPEDYKWGMSAEALLADHVSNNRGYYNVESQGIEQRISRLTEAVGGLADVLISKGILSPDDFLSAIGASSVYEVRPNKEGF